MCVIGTPVTHMCVSFLCWNALSVNYYTLKTRLIRLILRMACVGHTGELSDLLRDLVA